MTQISFVIICYNAESTIRTTLASIFSLDPHCDFEVIVIDDASQDRTLDLVKRFGKNFSNLTISRNKENRGRAHSRNRGLDKAVGEYICFVDADDFLNAVYFDGLDQIFRKQVDLIVTDRFDFDNKTRRPASVSHIDALFTDRRELEFAEDLPSSVLDNFVTGKFIRRQVIEQLELRFEEGRRNAEDILFTTALWLNAKSITFHHKPFYGYARGNYVESFGEEKCIDVLCNLGQLPELLNGSSTYRRREILANKYAAALAETVRRGQTKFSKHELADLYREHFDCKALFGFPFLRFVDDKERNFINACLNGEFLLAVSSLR